MDNMVQLDGIMMETYQFASLYALATTLHGREGDRVEIYAGIVTRL